MKTAKLPTKTFSDSEISLFETYEAKFLDFLEAETREKSANSCVFPAERLKRQSNFAERGNVRLKSLIFAILTGKSAKIAQKNAKNGKFPMFRAHSATKHEFHKLFQYRYYSFSLKRIKKRAFFNLLATLQQFNGLYQEISAAFGKENMGIYQEKLVFDYFP